MEYGVWSNYEVTSSLVVYVGTGVKAKLELELDVGWFVAMAVDMHDMDGFGWTSCAA